jgi:GntR family transcriptional regulator, negative regulator for fad regulon and positive regulator of fabA
MPVWSPPQRPAAHAEKVLLSAILDGTYPPGTTLPSERELAAILGVTRPTLREALRRMEVDGWLDIQQGKPTRINDFWKKGGLNALAALVQYSAELPADFIPNLLEVRWVLAPAYTRLAVDRAPERVAACLEKYDELDNSPKDYAAFDWNLHQELTLATGNPVFTLLLNGFSGFYEEMARRYFAHPYTRSASAKFYKDLLEAAQRGDGVGAEAITRRVMQESIENWKKAG